MNFSIMNENEILSDEVLAEVFDEENEIIKQNLLNEMRIRAKGLGIKGLLEEKIKAFKKIDAETKKKSAQQQPVPRESAAEPEVLQMLAYNVKYDKDGKENRKLAQTVRNFEIIMENDSRFAGKIKFNEFTMQASLIGMMPWETERCNRAWGSSDDSAFFSILQTDYGMTNRNDYFDAVKNVSIRSKFHPVRDILDGLEYDGKEHIKSLLPDYLGVEDTEYAYQVIKLWLLGAVARVYQPGIKFDYTMILQGKQGLGKSTFLRLLSLNDEWFNDSLDSLDSDKAAQSLMGSWIVELAELKSLARTAGGVESVKRFLTATQDKYRVPYERRADIFLRQCVFAGTTNKLDFLQDETGNRRFLIIQTGISEPTKDLFAPDAVDDMKAAWAQAVHIWKTEQPELVLPEQCRDEARQLQDECMADDGKTGLIEEFLKDKDRTCVLEVWREALKEDGRPKPYQSTDIKNIILSLPDWEAVKSPTNYKQYGKQRLFQKRACSQNSTACSQNSEGKFMSLDDFDQQELPFD